MEEEKEEIRTREKNNTKKNKQRKTRRRRIIRIIRKRRRIRSSSKGRRGKRRRSKRRRRKNIHKHKKKKRKTNNHVTCSIEDDAERFIVGPYGSKSLGRYKKFYIQSYQWQDRYLRADSNAAIVNQKRHKKDWEEFTCIPWTEDS